MDSRGLDSDLVEISIQGASYGDQVTFIDGNQSSIPGINQSALNNAQDSNQPVTSSAHEDCLVQNNIDSSVQPVNNMLSQLLEERLSL